MRGTQEEHIDQTNILADAKQPTRREVLETIQELVINEHKNEVRTNILADAKQAVKGEPLEAFNESDPQELKRSLIKLISKIREKLQDQQESDEVIRNMLSIPANKPLLDALDQLNEAEKKKLKEEILQKQQAEHLEEVSKILDYILEPQEPELTEEEAYERLGLKERFAEAKAEGRTISEKEITTARNKCLKENHKAFQKGLITQEECEKRDSEVLQACRVLLEKNNLNESSSEENKTEESSRTILLPWNAEAAEEIKKVHNDREKNPEGASLLHYNPEEAVKNCSRAHHPEWTHDAHQQSPSPSDSEVETKRALPKVLGVKDATETQQPSHFISADQAKLTDTMNIEKDEPRHWTNQGID